jgi:hypothetical protein
MPSFAPNAYGHDASQTYTRGCASSAHAYVGDYVRLHRRQRRDAF